MKKVNLVPIALGAFLSFSAVTALPAAAAENFTFSFDTGGVAFAYSDGYWDRDRNWHKWRNAREAREYRTRYADRYNAWKHTRDRNQGWRDEDRDGVPNRADRDRDGDGVSNRRDVSPDNPNRR